MRTPTDEQKCVMMADYGAPGLTVVNAYAGAGKTTTLEMICEANPYARILYLCYNKALQIEAKSRFPANAEVRTTHSLAYGRMVGMYKEKMGKNMRPAEIANKLGVNHRLAVIVRDTIAKFLQRPGQKILSDDIPTVVTDRTEDPMVINNILEHSDRLWKNMLDVKDPTPMPHDGYLKLWIETQPKLNYDLILLDEAQDTSPVVEELMLQQKESKSVVLVGDKNQAVYAWRGAINAMENATNAASRLFMLTTAFRLREPAAEMASNIIRLVGDTTRITAGNNGPLNAKGGTAAILSRTNASLLKEAFSLINQNKRIHFIGTKPENNYDPSLLYNFDEILDINHLRLGNRHNMKTPYIQLFKSYEQLAEIADVTNENDVVDKDLVLAFALVKEYKDALPGMVDKIRFNSHASNDADVELTTAHKAKGLEWDTVKMLSDFPTMEQLTDGLAGVEAPKAGGKKKKKRNWKEEVNILYVGVTRARDNLTLPSNLHERKEARNMIKSDWI